ncbi:MAG: cupin domain-containing protein [Spirochaetota bacterium]
MVVKHSDRGIVEAKPGIRRQQLVYGERTHMLRFFLEKGADLPLHTHEQEQTGYLLSGAMIMKVEGTRHRLGPGDSWSLPGNLPHGVEVLEDTELLEVFSPPREDYLEVHGGA